MYESKGKGKGGARKKDCGAKRCRPHKINREGGRRSLPAEGE